MNRKHFTAPLEIKHLDEGGSFQGYASVFGVQDSDGDVIVKGAFQNTIKQFGERGKMPKMLWQHNPYEICGRWAEMSEDENGLFVKGSLILETRRGREAYALLKAGVLDAMSVGFNIMGEDMESETMRRGRVITEVDLWEISLVTWGANPEALVSNVKSLRDFERFLRDSGYSRNQAAAIASKGYQAAFDQRESEDEMALKSIKNLTDKLLRA